MANDLDITKLVESEVDNLLYEDAYYEQFATPLKSAKQIRSQQRQYLVECLQLKTLRDQLSKATEIIFESLPKSAYVNQEQWSNTKSEFENATEHSQQFFKSVDEERKNHPVSLQEIFGFSDETLTAIYSLALAFVEESSFDNADCLLTLLTTLAPYVPSFWIAKGLCLQAQHNHQEALQLFEAAKLLDANSKEAIQYSIDSYLALNESDKAKEAVDQLKGIISQLDNEEERTLWEKAINKY